MLPGRDGADEADEGIAVGDDADGVGAAADLPVQPFLYPALGGGANESVSRLFNVRAAAVSGEGFATRPWRAASLPRALALASRRRMSASPLSMIRDADLREIVTEGDVRPVTDTDPGPLGRRIAWELQDEPVLKAARQQFAPSSPGARSASVGYCSARRRRRSRPRSTGTVRWAPGLLT